MSGDILYKLGVIRYNSELCVDQAEGSVDPVQVVLTFVSTKVDNIVAKLACTRVAFVVHQERMCSFTSRWVQGRCKSLAAYSRPTEVHTTS